MKILFLPSYFYPEQAASSYLGTNRFERYAKEGWEMVVYAPTPSRGIPKDVREQYKYIKDEKMYNDFMMVHRFSLFGEGKNPLIRAIRYTLQIILHFIKAISGKDARDCDLLFLSSTPPIQGMMGSWIKKLSHKKFIYCVQDIFPDSLSGTGLAKKGSLVWRIGLRVANIGYKAADKIIVISEDFKRNLINKGVPEEKIVVIYNWVEQDTVLEVPRSENKLIQKYNLDPTKFFVTYCGNIGLTQNMDMLMEVAKALEVNTDIHFVLVGNGAYKDELEKIIKERNIVNVTMIPFQPYEDISHVFSLGDVGIIISKPGVGANSVPSKTWSIMSASRPVLANFDENEIKTILENNKCGIFTKAGDKFAFTDAIIHLYQHPELCREYGKNGRKFVMENLTKEIGTAKYVEVIKEVVASHQKQ